MGRPLNHVLADWWDHKGWHYRRSLASRVAVLTAFALGISIALISATAFVAVRMHVKSALDESLLDRATKAANSSGILDEATRNDIPSWVFGAADVRIATITAPTSTNPEPLVNTADPGPKVNLSDPELRVAKGLDDHSMRSIRAEDGTVYRVAAVPAGQGTALVLLQSMEDTNRTMRALGTVLALFGGAGVAAAALAGWAVARNGLRPVRRLTSSVEQIARTQDLTPMPVEGDDEVARLTVAFNQMLVALDESRERQRRLIADAGHELRTPLTSLRTNIDLLAQAGDGLPREARDELIADVRAQLAEFTTLIGDLVELARDEPLTHVVGEFDLQDVVERALTRVGRRSQAVTFDVDLRPWIVHGEENTLERAVTNLLDNAVKWSPQDGVVRVRLVEGMLTVDDEGPGIPDEDLTKVFDRFYRSEDARSMPGSGLGLAIVAQAAARHAGAVRADRAPSGGARMIFWVPGAGLTSTPTARTAPPDAH